ELRLVPVRVHEEVPRHAVAEGARDPRRLDRRRDAGVLGDLREPRVRRGLEPEEDVEVLRDRAPGLEERRLAAGDVGARLDQDPALPDAARLQRKRELEAALGMVPEE